MQLRKILFWIHLAAGVTAGAIVLLMSVTGVLLTYERQLIEWSDRGFRSSTPAAGVPRLSVEQLLTMARQQRPGQNPSAITVRSDPAAPAAVAFGGVTVYQDVYTGRVLGEPTLQMRRAMSELRAWHRWLALNGESRAVGKAVTGWANIVFLFIILSGIFLWVPRRWSWQAVKAVTVFRGGMRGKARDFNWHNVFGIWCAVPLAIIVACAAPISFPWANALVYRMAGEAPPPPAPAAPTRNVQAAAPAAGDVQGLNAVWARAEGQVPGWRAINLRLPASGRDNLVFAIDSGTGGQPQKRAMLTLAPQTGAIVRWEPFEALSAGRRLRSWTRFAHTGEYFGLLGQTLAGLVTAVAVVLVVTGWSLAVRRFWPARKTARTLATARSASPVHATMRNASAE